MTRADEGLPHGLPTVLFEDEHLIAVDKPPGLLTQPGRTLHDSVHARVIAARPGITGPVIVHRLDCDTSGVLVLAKDAETHRAMSARFRERTVYKTYVAVVQGDVAEATGRILLPLRLDPDDRPRQIVCHVHGKPADTIFHRVSGDGRLTRLLLYPVTGRSHQLRVHLAHRAGLACPIVGDPLYGSGGARMLLHACRIEFTHPATGETCRIDAPVPF